MDKKKLVLLGSVIALCIISLTLTAIGVVRYVTTNQKVDRKVTVEVGEVNSPQPDVTQKPVTPPAVTPLKTAEPVETEDVTSETDSADSDNITLAFTGDVLLAKENLLRNYDKKGIPGILSDSVSKALSESDILMINQEFPFSNRGSKAEDKKFTFEVPPNRVNILKEMGVDIVSLANNHTLDFGTVALLDCFHALEQSEIPYVGAGENLERAKQIEFKTVKNMKIAYLAASNVLPFPNWYAGSDTPGLYSTYDPTSLVEQIKKAETEADFTVVYVHWGKEYKERPEKYQTMNAKQYIDAGADIVVGSHPHCLQGIEYYKNKPIIYSLGNFLFGSKIERTGVIKADIDKNKQVSLTMLPCKGLNYYTEELENETEIKDFFQYLSKISYNVFIDEDGKITPKN